jgi:hypothetical protein
MYLAIKALNRLITYWLAVALTLLDALQSLGCPLGDGRVAGARGLTQMISSAG